MISGLRVTIFWRIEPISSSAENHSVLIQIHQFLTITDHHTNSTYFSVDYLLPVPVEGNWVGVVYRDGQCIMALMDRYDITNKAIQCDPSFDIQSMEWFQNDFNRMRIIPDVPRKMRNSKKRKAQNFESTVGCSLHLQPMVSYTPSMDTMNSPSAASTVSNDSSQCSSSSMMWSSRSATPKTPSVPVACPPSISDVALVRLSDSRPSDRLKYHRQNVSSRNQRKSQQELSQQLHKPVPLVGNAEIQQWIQWTDRTIQTAVAEANYFMQFHHQYIGR